MATPKEPEVNVAVLGVAGVGTPVASGVVEIACGVLQDPKQRTWVGEPIYAEAPWVSLDSQDTSHKANFKLNPINNGKLNQVLVKVFEKGNRQTILGEIILQVAQLENDGSYSGWFQLQPYDSNIKINIVLQYYHPVLVQLHNWWDQLPKHSLPTIIPKEIEHSELIRTLDGTALTQLKDAAKKSLKPSFRIFVSSTFTDTETERNLLIELVYPYLAEYCRNLGVQFFQPSEMRWGIRDASSSKHLTEGICLTELERCQHAQGINYVLILGNKYGWRSPDAVIKADVFAKLLAHIEAKSSEKDKELVKFWYIKNDNNDTVMLRHLITNDLKNRFYNTDSKLLFDIIRFAADAVLPKEEAHHYHISVTHKEVAKGLLDIPASNRKDTCVVFDRRLAGVVEKPDSAFIDCIWGAQISVDSEAQKYLEALRIEIKELQHGDKFPLKAYAADWRGQITANNDVYLDYLKHFLNDFLTFTTSSIEAVARANTLVEDEVFSEALNHIQFTQLKVRQFVDVETTRAPAARIAAFLNNKPEEHNPALVVWGNSGSGKTSLLAVAAVKAATHNPNACVVVRFLGTTAHSYSPTALLTNLCLHIGRVYELKIDTPPVAYYELIRYFEQLLMSVPTKRPLFLFLDSLDQLSQDGGQNLAWIPVTTPSAVKIVVSTLPDEDIGYLQLLQERYKTFQNSAQLFVEVAPWQEEGIEQALKAMLEAEHRSLTSSQLKEVVQAAKRCPTPLFLKLCLLRSEKWRSFDAPEETTIAASSVRELLTVLFDEISRTHGIKLTNTVLGLLTISDGLSIEELLDVLSLDDDVLNDVYEWWVPPVRRLPPLLLTRLLEEVQPFLVERNDHGTIEIFWYHRQFWEAAEHYFYTSKTNPKTATSPSFQPQDNALILQIVKYFTGELSGVSQVFTSRTSAVGSAKRLIAPQPWFFQNGTPNLRKLDMLLRFTVELSVLTQSPDAWNYVRNLIENLETLQTAVAGGAVEEVLQFCRHCKNATGIPHDLLSFVAQYEQFITLNAWQLFKKENAHTVLQVALAMPDSHFASTAQKYMDNQHSVKALSEKNWSLVKHVNKVQELSARKATITVTDLKDAAISPDAKYIVGVFKNDLRVWESQSTVCTLWSSYPFGDYSLVDWRDTSDAVAVATEKEIVIIYFNNKCSAVTSTQKLSKVSHNIFFAWAGTQHIVLPPKSLHDLPRVVDLSSANLRAGTLSIADTKEICSKIVRVRPFVHWYTFPDTICFSQFAKYIFTRKDLFVFAVRKLSEEGQEEEDEEVLIDAEGAKSTGGDNSIFHSHTLGDGERIVFGHRGCVQMRNLADATLICRTLKTSNQDNEINEWTEIASTSASPDGSYFACFLAGKICILKCIPRPPSTDADGGNADDSDNDDDSANYGASSSQDYEAMFAEQERQTMQMLNEQKPIWIASGMSESQVDEIIKQQMDVFAQSKEQMMQAEEQNKQLQKQAEDQQTQALLASGMTEEEIKQIYAAQVNHEQSKGSKTKQHAAEYKDMPLMFDVVAMYDWHRDAFEKMGVEFSSNSSIMTSCPSEIAVWDVFEQQKGETVHQKHTGKVCNVVWSRDGAQFATNAWDNFVAKWSGEDGSQVVFQRNSKEDSDVVLTPEGEFCFVSHVGEIKIVDGKFLCNMEFDHRTSEIKFSTPDQILVKITANRKKPIAAQLAAVEKRDVKFVLDGNRLWEKDMTENQHLPEVSLDRKYYIWIITDGDGDGAGGDDGGAGGVRDTTLEVTKPDATDVLYRLPHYTFCCFFPDSESHMLCLFRDGGSSQHRKIHIPTGNIVATFPDLKPYVHYSFSPHCELLAGTTNEGVVILDGKSFKPTGDVFQTSGKPTDVEFSPTKKDTLVVVDDKGGVFLLNLLRTHSP